VLDHSLPTLSVGNLVFLRTLPRPEV
jgi:hypothetical protein